MKFECKIGHLRAQSLLSRQVDSNALLRLIFYGKEFSYERSSTMQGLNPASIKMATLTGSMGMIQRCMFESRVVSPFCSKK